MGKVIIKFKGKLAEQVGEGCKEQFVKTYKLGVTSVKEEGSYTISIAGCNGQKANEIKNKLKGIKNRLLFKAMRLEVSVGHEE